MTTASPAPAPAPTSASAASQAAQPPVHTYHCICAQLLLATTTPLPALPRRGAANPDSAPLDRAYILPLPTRPPGEDEEEEDEDEGDGGGSERGSKHYALLLNVLLDRKPCVVQREDGLEKRWLQRCARCKCAVGYALDWGHWGSEGAGRSGPRGDVVFLLEGALVGTGEVASAEGGEGAGK